MKDKKFSIFYIWISIIAGFLGFIPILIALWNKEISERTLGHTLFVFSTSILGIINLFLLSYFVLSICALIYFLRKKYAKIFFIIPSVIVTINIISLVIATINFFVGVPYLIILITTLGIPINIFVIILALFLLKKLKR